jgi:hypothetical protein
LDLFEHQFQSRTVSDDLLGTRILTLTLGAGDCQRIHVTLPDKLLIHGACVHWSIGDPQALRFAANPAHSQSVRASSVSVFRMIAVLCRSLD